MICKGKFVGQGLTCGSFGSFFSKISGFEFLKISLSVKSPIYVQKVTGVKICTILLYLHRDWTSLYIKAM